MKQISYATVNEIQRHGLEVLCKGPGVVGLIRFMQQFDHTGMGTMCKTVRGGRRNILLTVC